MGRTHSETKEERSLAFSSMLENAINEQLIKRLVLWNFGPNALEIAPRWTIKKNPPEDMKQRAEIDNMLQGMGLPIPKSYAQETYGIPEPVDANDTLTRTTAPVTPSGSGNLPADLPNMADGTVGRELKDVDRLLVQAQKQGADLLRDRVISLIKEVLPQ